MKKALIIVVLAAVAATTVVGCGSTVRTKEAGVDEASKPSISIMRAPNIPPGPVELGEIAGTVSGVNVETCKVVLFAKGDVWYVQPFTASLYTDIDEDGTWENNTHGGYQYAALLVNASYKPPNTTATLPNVGGDVLAVAEAKPTTENRASVKAEPTTKSRAPVKTINFSGYEWTVKSSQGRVGPGPNYFSDSTDNVWVDDHGRLHLRMASLDDRWHCAEVISKRSFGYGAYHFYLDSTIDNWDANVVLGLFTWNNEDPAYSHREIDIEWAKWGNAEDTNNAQYVLQPYDRPGHMIRFQVPSGLNATTHSFIWKRDSIVFRSLKGHYATPPDGNSTIQEWTFSKKGVPPAGGENARMNLWLVGGLAPKGGVETEIIIRKFEFVP